MKLLLKRLWNYTVMVLLAPIIGVCYLVEGCLDLLMGEKFAFRWEDAYTYHLERTQRWLSFDTETR